MPRPVAICAATFLLGGCFFSADYVGASCRDGICPAGLTCAANVCVAGDPGDAGSADALDALDARLAALTCADPGIVAAAGGQELGTTVGRGSTVSSMCGGFVMNGKDAVYTITLAAGDQLLVDIAGGRKAYVIATCVSPAPACLGNMFATAGNPISVTPAAGASFIIVDDENPANESTYTLTLTVN
jgi:hypothetical protein